MTCRVRISLLDHSKRSGHPPHAEFLGQGALRLGARQLGPRSVWDAATVVPLGNLEVRRGKERRRRGWRVRIFRLVRDARGVTGRRRRAARRPRQCREVDVFERSRAVALSSRDAPGQGSLRVFFRALPPRECKCGWLDRKVSTLFGGSKWVTTWVVLAASKLHYMEHRNQVKIKPDSTVDLNDLREPPKLDEAARTITLVVHSGKKQVLRAAETVDAAELGDWLRKIHHIQYTAAQHGGGT